MSKLYFLLAFVIAGSLFRSVDANPVVEECKGEYTEQCSKLILMSCDELLNEYTLQGSCCSLSKFGNSSCFVDVGAGQSCYWSPKCRDCPRKESFSWIISQCGVEYQGGEGSECPASEYPTNWSNGTVEGPWNDYKCPEYTSSGGGGLSTTYIIIIVVVSILAIAGVGLTYYCAFRDTAATAPNSSEDGVSSSRPNKCCCCCC